eukprot:819770-Rhodomonas_salina.1
MLLLTRVCCYAMLLCSVCTELYYAPGSVFVLTRLCAYCRLVRSLSFSYHRSSTALRVAPYDRVQYCLRVAAYASAQYCLRLAAYAMHCFGMYGADLRYAATAIGGWYFGPSGGCPTRYPMLLRDAM